MTNYEKTARKLIDMKEPQALEDALELCKALEKVDSYSVSGVGGEDVVFDDANFQTAHALARKVRTAANQLTKAGGGQRMLDLYFECHLFDAPYWFDSFCIYIERDREPKKKFYVPRRPQLLPCVEAMQDLEEGNIELLAISEPPGIGKTTLAEFFLAWEVGKHPELANLIGSHNNTFLNGVYGEMLRILDRQGEYRWGDVFPNLQVINTNARSMMIDIGRRRSDGKRFMSLEFSSIGSGNAGKVRASNLLNLLWDFAQECASKISLNCWKLLKFQDNQQRSRKKAERSTTIQKWSTHKRVEMESTQHRKADG